MAVTLVKITMNIPIWVMDITRWMHNIVGRAWPSSNYDIKCIHYQDSSHLISSRYRISVGSNCWWQNAFDGAIKCARNSALWRYGPKTSLLHRCWSNASSITVYCVCTYHCGNKRLWSTLISKWPLRLLFSHGVTHWHSQPCSNLEPAECDHTTDSKTVNIMITDCTCTCRVQFVWKHPQWIWRDTVLVHDSQ